MSALTDWLIHNLPPDSGPALSWAAAHFAEVRIPLLMLAAAIVMLEIAIVRGMVAWWRS